MKTIIITGATGLIGSEAVDFFSEKFNNVIGIDNNMRQYFFGENASTEWNRQRLIKYYRNYKHYQTDIREYKKIEKIFEAYNTDIELIIHTAAQPSHDWAAKKPLVDFSVNANGTINLLELSRQFCPESVFIFTSTNKVYGDKPNSLPFEEHDTRWEISNNHKWYLNGIDESMSIDNSKHSLFGASKLAADILVQEYGKYFKMRTGVFRGGCLTGPNHSGTQLHGFLSYLMQCAITGEQYKILGYKGKQVRDNIHSWDLVNMFWHFFQNPKQGQVYNVGGSRHSNCSILEAIKICEQITGQKMNYTYTETNRIGDHIWWISDVSKFQSHYPSWNYKYSLQNIFIELFESLGSRL